MWICSNCNEELGDYNGWCEYCWINKQIKVYNSDCYYIRDIRIDILADGAKPMTPQEQLFSELFNHETILVSNMSLLELRAHREELAKIAFEARARLSAVDEVERKAKKKDGQPIGFARSINADDTATNAINTIKERQKRMSKQEKILKGLEALGIDTAEAQKLMSSGTILAKFKQKVEEVKTASEETKPVFNPFAKIEE
jgi:hypothetical protein